MTLPSVTLTESERMKLIKWAKKNGASKIALPGVEIEFGSSVASVDSTNPLTEYVGPRGLHMGNDEFEAEAQRLMEKTREDDSTKKAMAALRSHLDDPDVFAHKSDQWANSTRLPR